MFDRENRETWQKQGSKELYARACEQVDRRLAAYEPIETDAAVDAEMKRLIVSGLESQTTLPVLPPPPGPRAADSAGRSTRANRRR